MKRMIVRKLERSSLQLGMVEWLEIACWFWKKHQFVGVDKPRIILLFFMFCSFSRFYLRIDLFFFLFVSFFVFFVAVSNPPLPPCL